MANAFLTGLAQGVNRTMDRRIQRLGQERQEVRADRQYEETLAREDARFSQQQRNWDKSFQEQGQQFDTAQKFRESQATQQQDNWGKTFKAQENRYTEGTQYRDRRDIITDDRWERSFKTQEDRYAEGITHRDKVFNRQGQQFDTVQQFRENQATDQQSNLDRVFKRQGEWRSEDVDYRRDAAAENARQFDVGHGFRQWRANTADAQFQETQEYEKWYKGEYLKYLNASAAARGRGSGGSGANLDSQTVEAIENIADNYAKTFTDAGSIPFWFDRRVNPAEQGEYMEAQGEQIMNLMMLRFPGNPTAALQYLPSFWGRFLKAGQEGKYGEEARKKIHDWVQNSPDRVKQETVMFNALQRGAMKALGIESTMKAGVTKIPHLEDQTQSVGEDMSDAFKVGQAISPGTGLGFWATAAVPSMKALGWFGDVLKGE